MSVAGPYDDDILNSDRTIYTPGDAGVMSWVSGDVYRVAASREDGVGRIGFIDGIVPVGGGPIAHVHKKSDESFFVASGTIAFLSGTKTIAAEPGSFVHVPQGTLHRFKNVGDVEARLLFFFNPAGPELMFNYAGDKPAPGSAPIVWDADRFAEALDAVAHLDVDIFPHPELDHLFRPGPGAGGV
ncbi:cupin domain-containing protein [Actinoplanes sp. TBRC 11911]|uniref:cupin domain-containing protein n=1 Tax=Actinoplanes sp. TBRC 11911 TaxID=2729386 RepID=UPI00145D8828|nr:cupin domain-containing protein [Actinoplanes sp. TBRC 11911]NMO53762.1 cupin domain-containing protein [Actinoplanes sp. TBRC 11911]